MSLPTNSIFDKELSRVESDDKRKHFRHLFGYLHCQGTDLGQEFFRRTAMQDPYINLAVLNRIPRQDKQMRIKTFIQLSNIKGESPTYYRTCSRVENNTTHESKEGIVRLIEDCTEIKDQRTMALKILDVLIDSKDFELAVKVVQLVTDILRKNSSEEWRQQNKNPQLRFEGDGGAFGRRELVIYDALDQPEEMKSVVKRLLSIYNPDRKFDKAFKVAELSFRRCKTFENTCVTSLRRQNKRKEAAHAALNITFLLVTSKEFVRAQGMLSTLKRMNPQLDLFNSEEQLMIQLLESHIQKQLSHQ